MASNTMSSQNQFVAPFLKQNQDFTQQIPRLYPPLDKSGSQFRLMHVQPAEDYQDPVHITLTVQSFASHLPYEAISYTWGKLTPVSQVSIDGSIYNVTEEQVWALRRLRFSDEVRVAWMDVICINQYDSAEKSQQVGFMDKIYAQSDCTIIWLGEPWMDWFDIANDEAWESYSDSIKQQPIFSIIADRWGPKRSTSAILQKGLESMPNDALGTAVSGLFIVELLSKDFHLTTLPVFIPDEQGTYQLWRPWYDARCAMIALLKRPWWYRVWTLQEALLSKAPPVVQFGPIQKPLSLFTKAASYWNRHCEVGTGCCNQVYWQFLGGPEFDFYQTNVLKLGFASKSPKSMLLHSALENTVGRKATDPRDFLYGVLGLVKRDARMAVDYKLTPAQVLAKVTFHLICITRSCSWLEFGSNKTSERTPGLPSWATDWPSRTKSGFGANFSFDEQGRECCDSELTIFEPTTLYLQVVANPVGTIGVVFERTYLLDNYSDDKPPPPQPPAKTILAWLEQMNEFIRCTGASIEVFDSSRQLSPTFYRLLRAIFRDTVFDPTAKDMRIEHRLKDKLTLWWKTVSGNKDKDHQWSSSEWQIMNLFTHAFQASVHESTLCLMEDGTPAMVPSKSQTGDRLYHIRSCPAPLLLRPLHDNAASNTVSKLNKQKDLVGQLRSLAVNTSSKIATGLRKKPGLNHQAQLFQVIGSCYLEGKMGPSGRNQAEEQVIVLG